MYTYWLDSCRVPRKYKIPMQGTKCSSRDKWGKSLLASCILLIFLLNMKFLFIVLINATTSFSTSGADIKILFIFLLNMNFLFIVLINAETSFSTSGADIKTLLTSLVFRNMNGKVDGNMRLFFIFSFPFPES